MAVAWTCVLLAGADWPPPRGFSVAILLACAAGAWTYVRAPRYVVWSASRRRGRVLLVMAEGFSAGLLVGALFMLIRHATSQGDLQPIHAAAWLAALGAAGMVHALISYALLTR